MNNESYMEAACKTHSIQGWSGNKLGAGHGIFRKYYSYCNLDASTGVKTSDQGYYYLSHGVNAVGHDSRYNRLIPISNKLTFIMIELAMERCHA